MCRIRLVLYAARSNPDLLGLGLLLLLLDIKVTNHYY